MVSTCPWSSSGGGSSTASCPGQIMSPSTSGTRLCHLGHCDHSHLFAFFKHQSRTNARLCHLKDVRPFTVFFCFFFETPIWKNMTCKTDSLMFKRKEYLHSQPGSSVNTLTFRYSNCDKTSLTGAYSTRARGTGPSWSDAPSSGRSLMHSTKKQTLNYVFVS